MLRKNLLRILTFALLVFMGSLVYRALPIVKEKESFRAFFPSKAFLHKLSEPTPAWMESQIEEDFQEIGMIRTEMIDEAYYSIKEKIGNQIFRYRILDNCLYKYIPRRREFSSKDTPFEKAFKTLLLNTQVPDVDFLLCTMDGIPEPYVPQDFYITKNLVPILGQAKLKGTKFIVLIPDQFSLSDDWYKTSKEIVELNQEIPWEDKKNQAVWRGTLTDTGFPDKVATDFSSSPRSLLSRLSNENPHLINAGITYSTSDENQESLKKGNLLKPGLSKKEHLIYKYQPVMDGHMCTYPGYQWRLLSNSIAIKQESDQIQWFYRALSPYVHYVPIKNDASDLVEKIFWAQEHDQELFEISKRARDFASNHLMLEDNYKYLYLVLKKTADHQEMDIQKIKKETQNDPSWKCIQYRSRLRLMKTIRYL